MGQVTARKMGQERSLFQTTRVGEGGSDETWPPFQIPD